MSPTLVEIILMLSSSLKATNIYLTPGPVLGVGGGQDEGGHHPLGGPALHTTYSQHPIEYMQ